MSLAPRRSCQMAALAMAMNAKCGPVYRDEVARLALLAVLIEEDDPLREACFAFARIACSDFPRSGAVALAGAELQRAIERSTWLEVDARGGGV